MSGKTAQSGTAEACECGLSISTIWHDMVYSEYGKVVKLYDDYKAAMAEVKCLNAAEREKVSGLEVPFICA